MKYAYFAPCNKETIAKDIDQVTKAIAKKLNIELLEGAFSCCGRNIASDANADLALLANVRNLAVAEQLSADLLTISSTCYNALKKAAYVMQTDKAQAERINKKLQQFGLKYTGKIQPIHLVDALYNAKDEVESQAASRLAKIRLAPLYGAQFTRPAYYMEGQTGVAEKLFETLGAKTIEFPQRNNATGYQIAPYNQKTATQLTAEILNKAKELGADALVTLCPHDHLMCDAYQRKAIKKADLPILHLSQVVGFALGIKELGFEKHFISPSKLYNRIRS